MSVVPESWGTSGYWTIEGKTEHLTTDQVDSYAIKDKTTFIWHKTETPIEKFSVSFTVDNAQHGSLEGQSEFKDIAQGTPWTEAGIEVPNPIPAEGHKFDGWYEGETKTENFPDTVDGNHTYVAKFTELAMKELSYRVQYFKNDKFDSEKTVVTNDVLQIDPDTIIVDKTQINITDKYDGYVFDKVMTGEIPSTIQNGGVIKVYYVTDVEGGEKPGEGDGTPDKYQVKVTYDVVNGRWNDDSADTKYEYVTLYKDGNMPEDGEGTLSSVPAVGDKPATGFKAGEWNAKTSQVITKEGNQTFTYEYAEADLQDVYVYAQITGNIPEGTQINKDGYYTIGKTKLPITISPDKVGDGNSIITGESSCITVDDAKYALKNNFVHHAENQVITADLLHDKMESLDVKAESQGATGYVNSGWTWHMDIQISFSEVQYLYKTLTYKDGVENELFKPINKQILVGNTVEKHDFDGSIEGTQDPVRPGYIFTGWKDNNDNVVDLTNGKYVMPEENVTLTAQWEVDENSRNYPYVIHYVYVDSGNQTILYSDKGNGYIGQIIDVPEKSFEGYTVKENNPTSLTVKEDGSAEVYVYYDINTYEVRWINDDERETILEHDTSVKYGEQPVYNAPNPEKVSDKEYIYEFVGWTPKLKPLTENITYKATYSSIKRLYPYSVKYLYDGKSIDEPYLGAPKGGQAEYGSEVSINPNKAIVIDGNNYVLVSQNHIIKIEEYEDKNIIYVKYELDNNKDDIPDKYQRTVTFTAINGGFNGDVSNTEVRLIVTLLDSKGNLNEHGTYYLHKSDVPLTNAPQAGYATVVIKYDQFGPYEKEAKWYPLIAVLTNGVTTIQDNINYKFTYIEEELPGKSLGVRHFIENENGEITQTPVPGGELIGPFGVSKNNPFYEMTVNTFQNYTFKVTPPIGYCFDRLELRSRESHNGQEYTLLNVLNPEDVVPGYALDYSEVNHYEFAYIYSVDENNNQIPDKYEVTVKYEVENGLFNEVQFGSLNEAQTIVTQQYELAESVNGIWQVKEVVLDNIPIPTPDDGYDPMSGKWEYEPKKGTLITKDLDGVVYKYKYDSKIQLKALIKYVDEEQQDQPIDTQEVTINYGDDVVTKKYVKAFPNYVLIDDTQVAADVKENGQAVTILYAKDVLGGGLPNTGDDIPDKYQVTLTFNAVNGEFIENESPEVTKVITLVDENGNFSDKGTFILTDYMLPKARPLGTYTGVGSRDHLLPNEPQSTVITKEGPFTFTIRFNQIMTSEITINTHYECAEDVEDVVTSKTTEEVGTEFTHDFADEVTYEDNHYVLESVNPGETITVDASAADNVIDAYYVLDNDGGKEPGEGDGTPDKYQVKVTYEAVNGTVSFAETFVTLHKDGVMGRDLSRMFYAENL